MKLKSLKVNSFVTKFDKKDVKGGSSVQYTMFVTCQYGDTDISGWAACEPVY